MPYNIQEEITPFWAEYPGEASGRDPLAIQNSSVVIYTKMVVGITNVTNRIRYMGFYCWVFENIALNIKKSNSLSEQMRLNRRAELLLAYIMTTNFPEATGVSGSEYAKKNLRSKISLKNGADWQSKIENGYPLYWKFKFGVFGQYYSGVVRDLDLINHPSPQLDLNIYTVTSKGKELAKVFQKNIPKRERDTFLEAIINGVVNEEDLGKLKSFALHVIPEGSAEAEFYQSLLLSHDDKKGLPTFNRRNTIKLLLTHLYKDKDKIEDLSTSFLRANYNQNISQKFITIDTSTAWYLFEINEILHVAFEHFHSSFLYSIESYPTSLEGCIDGLLKKVEKSFKEDSMSISNFSLKDYYREISANNKSVYFYYDAMESAFNQDDFGECLKFSIGTILSVYLDCNNHLDQLQQFASLTENNFNRRGYAIELVNDLILSKWELSIYDYIKEILIHAINLHTFSSYSKTKIGQNLVHNYIIEDHMVWRLRETLPNRTSPRLQNVIQFISDIGLINKEGKKYTMTDSGTNAIGI